MTTLPITSKSDTIIKPRHDANDIQRILDEADGRGSTLSFQPGTYELDRALLFPSNTRILAYGARIILRLKNDEPAHDAREDASIEGGTWETLWTGTIYSGIYGCVWRFGCYYGQGRTTRNVRLANMRVDTTAVWPAVAPYFGRGGNGIFVGGGTEDMRFENISTHPVVPAMSQVIAGHWGCATKSHTVGTLHPSMRIDRLRAGLMMNPHIETSPISTSAVAWAEINDVDCLECASGFVAYAGDYGYDYCLSQPGMVSVSNYRVRRARWRPIIGATTKTSKPDSTRYDFRSVFINCEVEPIYPASMRDLRGFIHTSPVK